MKEKMMIKTTYKTGATYFGFFICISLTFLSCQKEKLTAQEIVERSIAYHGGSDKWDDLKVLSFDKTTVLFYPDGSTESKVEQFNLFKFQPNLFGKIEWAHNGDDFLITYDNGKVEKMINDSIITSFEVLEQAKNSFFASQYVVCQPFNLMSDDAFLTFEGEEIIDNIKVLAVNVRYESDHENSDRWTYYFDAESYKLRSNKVIRPDHTSLVQNLTFDTSTDFIFHGHRKSYRLTPTGEKEYLRAEYFYENFDITY
jgi:hypothetical protein